MDIFMKKSENIPLYPEAIFLLRCNIFRDEKEKEGAPVFPL